MLSPFPGMDPLLEEPSRWPGVHHRLISQISDVLTEQVTPHFFVSIAERVYIVSPDKAIRQPIAPDVYLVRGQSGETTAVVASTITTPTLVEALYDLDVHDRYLEIRDTESQEVVTTIEILSPFNKATGTQGFEAFQRKRRAVMVSPVHWLEIDLLRAGERPREVAAKSDYYALLKRGGAPGPFEVWYSNLRDRLPTIAVPLRPPFPDVPLNLQAVFEAVYARAAYAVSIDYTRLLPLPSLQPADAAWVVGCLQNWRREPAE